MTFEELRREAQSCEQCSLAKTRTNVVFGVGNPRTDLLFVGEAPGYHEDKQGEPFVGAAGKLLDELLASIGMARSDIYIANVLKCRPPGNRDPNPDEIELCKPFLLKQVELIRPRVICALGNFATRLILEKNVSISRVHGQEFRGKGYLVMPTYHPAAALYARTTLTSIEEDFQKLKEIYAKATAAVEAPAELEAVSEQLGLF
ncbi:MAG: uracil-DNA glycosylase [Actinobacteria bacterium]|nr:uracil-DNA glycosylase [Actinomycetota bacterium]